MAARLVVRTIQRDGAQADNALGRPALPPDNPRGSDPEIRVPLSDVGGREARSRDVRRQIRTPKSAIPHGA